MMTNQEFWTVVAAWALTLGVMLLALYWGDKTGTRLAAWIRTWPRPKGGGKP